jgi:Flp pilus assembly protein TadG
VRTCHQTHQTINRTSYRPSNQIRRFSPSTGSEQRGSAMPLLLLVVAVCALGAVGLARLGGAASQRSGAQQGADAAALAGARYDETEAARLAQANGAVLTAFSLRQLGSAREVDVSVTKDGVIATASARWDPPPPPPTTTLPMETTLPIETTLVGNLDEVSDAPVSEANLG